MFIVDFQDTNSAFNVEFNAGDNFTVDLGNVTYDEYQGTYDITPGASVQTLNTKNKILLDNIKVNPIPDNYGLITWDGATLTVS